MNNILKNPYRSALFAVCFLIFAFTGFDLRQCAYPKALNVSDTAYLNDDLSGENVRIKYENRTYTKENRLNINSAHEKQLESLDKIGRELARRIIKFRDENGAYASAEELLSVKGIGKTRLAAIKDYITVEGIN